MSMDPFHQAKLQPCRNSPVPSAPPSLPSTHHGMCRGMFQVSNTIWSGLPRHRGAGRAGTPLPAFTLAWTGLRRDLSPHLLCLHLCLHCLLPHLAGGFCPPHLDLSPAPFHLPFTCPWPGRSAGTTLRCIPRPAWKGRMPNA